MKITKVYFERTFNLGNYESAKIGLEAEVEQNEDYVDTYEILKKRVLALKEKGVR